MDRRRESSCPTPPAARGSASSTGARTGLKAFQGSEQKVCRDRPVHGRPSELRWSGLPALADTSPPRRVRRGFEDPALMVASVPRERGKRAWAGRAAEPDATSAERRRTSESFAPAPRHFPEAERQSRGLAWLLITKVMSSRGSRNCGSRGGDVIRSFVDLGTGDGGPGSSVPDCRLHARFLQRWHWQSLCRKDDGLDGRHRGSSSANAGGTPEVPFRQYTSEVHACKFPSSLDTGGGEDE